MTNTTTVYWDVDGTSLQNYAWNIQSLGGPRAGLPTHRGENVAAAYRRGSRWQPKTVAERPLGLDMWVVGCNDDGTITNPKDEEFRANLNALQKMFWKDDSRMVSLTKRFKIPGGTIISAVAQAELVGTMEPSQIGPFAATFMVDLMLPDPFFYAALKTSTLAKDVAQNVVNAGDAGVTGFGSTIEFNGPLTNPRITNSTSTFWVQYGGSIAGGDKVTIDLDNFTARRQSDDANVIGAISRSGDRKLLVLRPGTSSLLLTATAGTGTAAVKYREPYF